MDWLNGSQEKKWCELRRGPPSGPSFLYSLLESTVLCRKTYISRECTYTHIYVFQESGPICNCPYLNLLWARRASLGDYSVKALPRRNTKTSWLTVIVTTFREGLTDTFTYERHQSLSYIDCLWRSDFSRLDQFLSLISRSNLVPSDRATSCYYYLK